MKSVFTKIGMLTLVLLVLVSSCKKEETNSAPEVNNHTFLIDENSPEGTYVGQVIATDVDSENLTFEIVRGNTNAAFNISAYDGKITVQNQDAIDYETIPSFILDIKVKDDKGASATGTVVIQINNIEIDINNQSFIIDENSPEGTIVGQVMTSDADSVNLTFEIVGGNTNEAFSISPRDGIITVQNEEVIDFETNPSFILDVKVKDDNGESATATILIQINNIEIIINNQSFIIDENSLEGTLVGQVIALISGGKDDLLNFKIIEGNISDAFTISPENGEITVQNEDAIDFEINTSFLLIVEVSDGKGEIATAMITIDLNNLTEPAAGLILYLPFNGNAKDQSPNNYNGTVHGAVPTLDRKGSENSAYFFDGIDDYIEIGDKEDLSFSNNKNFTISLWVDVKSDDKNQFMISKYYSTGDNREYSLVFNKSWYSYKFAIYNGNITDDYVVSRLQPGWHHIVGMKTNNKIYMFVDGELVSEKTYLTNQLSSFARLIIGACDRSNVSPDGFFHGSIDDVAVYNRALSIEEIKTLYKEYN